MPKESLEDPYLYDTYHKTKPMVDLTTSIPFNLNRSEGNYTYLITKKYHMLNRKFPQARCQRNITHSRTP